MIDTDKYEVHLWYAPNEGEIHMYGVFDEMRSFKTKEEAIAYYDDVDFYYAKQLVYYYNGLDGDILIEESNEYLEEVFTKALVLDKIMEWHKRMQLQGESIAYRLDRMDWLLKNPTKKYEDYDEVIE